FACGAPAAVTQPGGPFELSGPAGIVRLDPLSPSPANSRNPCTFEADRDEFTSAVVCPATIGTSPLNSNVFVSVWSGRFSVTNPNEYGVSGFPPKSFTPSLTSTPSSASSGNSPNTGFIVRLVDRNSCTTPVAAAPGGGLVGYAPSPGTVDVTVGAADGIWSSNSSGSVSSRVWNDELTVPWSGLPCRSRSANSSGDPITVTR